MPDWKSIYETQNFMEAQYICETLINNDINAVVMDQRDSAYTIFGSVRVHVQAVDVIKAIHIIKSMTENKNE